MQSHTHIGFCAQMQASGDATHGKILEANAKGSTTRSTAVLAKENTFLKARLQQVEEAATDALGELQDARDEVDAHKQAIKGAEQQVRSRLLGCYMGHLWGWSDTQAPL
jgi:hypothetical protein